MPRLLTILMPVQALLFTAAAMLHSGFFVSGYKHRQATVAEAVIAGVLIFGFLASHRGATHRRAFALGAQVFALVGTLVGLFTMLAGIGPQTRFDQIINGLMIFLLVFGCIWTSRPITSQNTAPMHGLRKESG